MIDHFYVAALVIVCCCASASPLEYDNVCHYNYDYKCASQVNKHTTSFTTDKVKLCEAKHVPKDVNFNIMSDDNNSSGRGVVNVDFKSPGVECKYRVSLFVNPRIDNSEDCRNYVFREGNHAEIHTMEKTICPVNRDDDRPSPPSSAPPCKDVLNMWYEYIYTGCYALGFKVGLEDYTFVGNEFLRTDYERTEVSEPKLRCTYKSTAPREDESSVETVTIATDVSLLAGSSGVRLEVARHSLLHENERDACNRYSEHPLVSLLLGMSVENDTDAADDSCSVTTTLLSTGQLAKTIECSFVVHDSSRDTGYCFLVRILDERCQKNTSWKPPLRDKVPCAWTQHCLKTDGKGVNASAEEQVKSVADAKTVILELPRTLRVFLILAIILVALAASSMLLVACSRRRRRRRRRTRRQNVKTKAGDLEEEDASAVLEDFDGAKSQKEKLVKESGIVVLYVKESDQFMAFMAQFGRSLKHRTGCDVYDWWAPESWNDVARLGGYEWVVKMLRKDCRVVWMDTPKARTLFAANRKNGHNRWLKQAARRSESLFEEISDFRESVFPAIVDFAKRNNQDIEQEYQRHFVVRLETFVDADKTQDPFADLSPHARYLIPCHLDELCSQLSIGDHVGARDEISAVDKVHLGKYLFNQV